MLIFPWHIIPESKESAFKRYVLDDIPANVKVIKKGGHVSLAGGNEWVVLTFSSDAYKQIINVNNMKKYEYTHKGERNNHRDFAYMIASGENIKPMHYYTNSEPNSSSWKVLILNEDYSKGLFFRGRL